MNSTIIQPCVKNDYIVGTQLYKTHNTTLYILACVRNGGNVKYDRMLLSLQDARILDIHGNTEHTGLQSVVFIMYKK